jgi:hypothetical protein
MDIFLHSTVKEPSPMSDEKVLSAQVIAEIQANRKVTAIKLVREQHNLGLKEAKELVDAYMAAHPPSPGESTTQSRGGSGRMVFVVILAGLGYSLYRYFS